MSSRVLAALASLWVVAGCGEADPPAGHPIPSPGSTPETMARVASGVLPRLVLVDQAGAERVDLDIPDYATAARLEGTYRVEPAPRARLDVTLLDASGAVVYEKLDSSGDLVRLALRPGRHTLVFQYRGEGDLTNSYGPPLQRGVRGELELSYDRPR